MNIKVIIYSAIGLILIVALIYYLGFIRAFQNFGNDPPAYLKVYELANPKDTVEKRMFAIIEKDTTFYTLDTINVPAGATKWNWLILSLGNTSDKTNFTFRFAGDSALWKQQSHSSILLFSVTSGKNEMDTKTTKVTDRKITEKLCQLFETKFIGLLKKDPGK